MINLKNFFFIVSLMLYSPIVTYGKYTVPTGYKDRERLLALNETYNPSTISFLKKHIKPGDRVLDVGCGLGILSQEISQIVGKDGDVLGVDNSKEQVKLAKELAEKDNQKNIRYATLDANKLCTLKGKFDVIYIRFLLIHLENPDQIISKLKPLLKPSGRIILEECMGVETLEGFAPYPVFSNYFYAGMIQLSTQNSCFSVGRYLRIFLEKNGYKILDERVAHPSLDTLQKRRNFSLAMRSLKQLVMKKSQIEEKDFDQAVKKIEKIEENLEIPLKLYKVKQIVAQLP